MPGMPEITSTRAAAQRTANATDTARPRAGRYPRFAWGVLGFNLLVILWGAFVRATGSGAGCGRHWPLCNGEVVPHAPAVATLIEFAHRASSGIALLLVVGLIAGAWRGYPRGHPVRLGAALSGLFMLSEALVGAGLVLFEYVAGDTRTARAYWVGGHLVNTFLLVAALALTAWWASGGGRSPRRRNLGSLGALLALALGGTLLLGVSGAITALGDTLFPVSTLAEGKAMTFSPTAHVFVRLRIWHPTLAVLVGIAIVLTALAAARARPLAPVRRLALALIGLYAVQLAVGVLNMWFLAPVALQIVHLLLSDGVWIVLVLLATAALAADAPEPRVAA